MTMTTEKELGEALKTDKDTIEVEGDLSKKIIKIKATGKVAWGVCIGCIVVACTMAVVTLSTGGTAAPVTGPTTALTLSAAASVWGLPTAITATGIALAGGGVVALKKLRKYRIEKISDTKIILHKK